MDKSRERRMLGIQKKEEGAELGNVTRRADKKEKRKKKKEKE